MGPISACIGVWSNMYSGCEMVYGTRFIHHLRVARILLMSEQWVPLCVVLALHCYKSRIYNQRCTQIYMSKSLSLYCMINNFSRIWIVGVTSVADPAKQGSSCKLYCNGENIGRKEKAELSSLILTREGGFVHMVFTCCNLPI